MTCTCTPGWRPTRRLARVYPAESDGVAWWRDGKLPVLARQTATATILVEVPAAGSVAPPATVLAQGTRTSVLILVPSLLVLGFGMGACFSSIYDVAIGDIAPAEAGSASGTLSAVQQLAAAIGSAVVTTVYFSQQHQHGSGHAMTVAVAVVGAITVACLGLVWLLPKSAPADGPGPA
jgi:MFS family permease